MRAAPPVTVTVGRPRAALLAFGALAVAALAACTRWAWERQDIWGVVVVLLATVHACWTVRAVLRRDALQLRWDGVRWWIEERTAGGPRSGTLAVALDLGAFLLLRFRGDAPGAGRTRWLPAERPALAADWHALRCAVHSPRASRPVAVGPHDGSLGP